MIAVRPRECQPAPQEIILTSGLLKTRDVAMTGAAFHGVQPATLEISSSVFAGPKDIIVQTSVQNKSEWLCLECEKKGV